MDNHEFKNEDYLDPKYWKWGIFYLNRNGKRISLPKRIKQIGWTLNSANPISIFALFTLIAIIYFTTN